MSEKIKIRTRIPSSLCKDSLLKAVGLGCYLMIDGSRPKNIPECEKVNKRIELSPKGEEYLSALLSSGEFKSKAELITTALAYLAEQPAWVYQLGATTI